MPAAGAARPTTPQGWKRFTATYSTADGGFLRCRAAAGSSVELVHIAANRRPTASEVLKRTPDSPRARTPHGGPALRCRSYVFSTSRCRRWRNA